MAAADVRSVIGQVRRRIRWQNGISGAVIGLAVGCCSAVLLAAVAAAVGTFHWYWLAGIVAATTAGGGLLALGLPVSSASAAARIDRYYGIKDRAITALQFESDNGPIESASEPVRRLQIADAQRHLAQVQPRDCVPWRASRPMLISSAAMLAVATAILLTAQPPRSIEPTARTPAPIAVTQASLLRQTMLPELETLKDQLADSPELPPLLDRLDQLLQQMETEAVDEVDLMATLSAMEQAIAETQQALQLAATDAQLKGVAEAFLSSEAMKRAAEAMQDERYEAASEQLQSIDPAAISDKERRAVSDDLKQFLSKLTAGKQGKLSETVGEIQQGLEQQNHGQCQQGLKKLAGLCQSQAACKQLGQCLASQLNRLAQCKSQCQGGSGNGGDSVAKSDSPSQAWGTGASGQPLADQATQLDSLRQQEQLTGPMGDGASETELLESPEAEQTAARAYVQRYQQFRAQAEAVLDREPLPPGHRQTVRQYFESIRPDSSQTDSDG